MSTSIPLLVTITAINSVLNRACMTPLSPPPKQTERERIAKTNRDGISWGLANFIIKYVKFVVDAISLTGIYVMLSTAYPEWGLPALPTPKPANLGGFEFSTPFLIGTAILWFGSFVRISCFLIMGKNFTFQLAILDDHTLITSGPYGVVRHPSYTAVFLQSFGIAISLYGSTGTWWTECGMWATWLGWFLAGTWFLGTYLWLRAGLDRIPKEDRMLRDKFGDKWDKWAKKTPYRLIPFVY